MSDPGRQPTEAELRAALEEEMRRVRVEDIVLQSVVSLVNLGARRVGLAAGEEERDLDQAHTAIEAVRALLPLLERAAPDQMGPIRDALTQLQLAYVRAGGQRPTGGEAGAPEGGAGEAGGGGPAGPAGGEGSPQPPPRQEGPGPAQRSGRLWVPGQ